MEIETVMSYVAGSVNIADRAALDDITSWNLEGPSADRIHVVNMSLGGHDPSATLAEAVARASASVVSVCTS